MHDARAVANWLIDKAVKAKRPLTPLQVIKLVYFAHGWMLAFFGHRLFRQPVEAWEYGPVIADVYHALKQYRASPIDLAIPGIPAPEFNDRETAVLEEVYRAYAHLPGVTLSSLTHHDGSPWDKTKRGGVIDDQIVKDHFKELLHEHA